VDVVVNPGPLEVSDRKPLGVTGDNLVAAEKSEYQVESLQRQIMIAAKELTPQPAPHTIWKILYAGSVLIFLRLAGVINPRIPTSINAGEKIARMRKLIFSSTIGAS
jgi:hypothetical protein